MRRGAFHLDDLFRHVVAQESNGRAGAVGPATKYGHAIGASQMLPATARGMASKLGIPWRPDLLASRSSEATSYQLRLGKAYLQEGLEKTGNVRDALQYYHGGPDRSIWGPKTHRYAGEVLARMGMK